MSSGSDLASPVLPIAGYRSIEVAYVASTRSDFKKKFSLNRIQLHIQLLESLMEKLITFESENKND